MIGKGPRGKAVLESIKKNSAVYFAAVRGLIGWSSSAEQTRGSDKSAAASLGEGLFRGRTGRNGEASVGQRPREIFHVGGQGRAQQMAIGQGREVVTGVPHGVRPAVSDMNLPAPAVTPSSGSGNDAQTRENIWLKGPARRVPQHVLLDPGAGFGRQNAEAGTAAIRRMGAGLCSLLLPYFFMPSSDSISK